MGTIALVMYYTRLYERDHEFHFGTPSPLIMTYGRKNSVGVKADILNGLRQKHQPVPYHCFG